MSSAPKTVPKKLYGREEIQVDEQILRWRSRMRRQEIRLGKAALAADRKAAKMRKHRETDSDEKLIERMKKRYGNS